MRLVGFRRRSDYLLALIDVATALLACWLGYVLRFQGELPLGAHYASRYFGASVGVVVAAVVAGRAAGLYRRAALRPGSSNVEPAVESAVVIGLALLVVDAVFLGGDLSRAWIGLVTLFLILLATASRWLLAHSRRALVPLGVALERYAIVGQEGPARRLLHDLTRSHGAPFRIVKIIPGDEPPGEVAQAAMDLRVDGLVLAAGTAPDYVAALAAGLAGHGIDVLLAPRLGELDLRVASVVAMHGVPLLRIAGAAPRRPAIRRQPGSTARGVAILGTRGIPANYGGFETFAERLSQYLVAHGVPVTVYCRRHHASAGREWRGVQLVTLPTIPTKYLDTIVHTVLSALHLVLRTRIRTVILCNAANAPVLPLLRAARVRTVMNVDGLEWRRGKWGVLGRTWYRLGEWLSVRWSSVLVTDAEEVRTYYRVRHDTDSVMVPYGADQLQRGLTLPPTVAVVPDRYVLYVSRWERENNPVLVVRAHAAAPTDLDLVLLGTATYDRDLDAEVRALAGARVRLPGAIFGDGYHALQANARCYVHATEVGGTHPALVEAMGAGNLCLVLDTPENREVAGPDAWYFTDEADLSRLLAAAATLEPVELERLRSASRCRAASLYSWERVGARYRELLTGTLQPRS